MRPVLILFVFCLTAATPAWAQIYSWRDGQGALVVSDRPRTGGGAMTTYAVPGAAAVKANRPASAGSGGPSEFDDIIALQAGAQGVSPELVRAVIQVESAFNPRAVSPKGAMGLMQLMPATARDLGVVNPFHPEENIRGGVAYLRQLLNRYGQVELALAAYNAGPGSVERYGAVPPYRETQDYVKKVTGASGPPPPPDRTIYRWIETIDGRVTVRYSNKPPAGVAAEPVGRRK